MLGKSYSITAEVEIPAGGAEGMLNTNGGSFGGWGLYLLKSKPVFTYVQLTSARFRWEGPEALTPGKHTIAFDFTYDGPGFGKGGNRRPLGPRRGSRQPRQCRAPFRSSCLLRSRSTSE